MLPTMRYNSRAFIGVNKISKLLSHRYYLADDTTSILKHLRKEKKVSKFRNNVSLSLIKISLQMRLVNSAQNFNLRPQQSFAICAKIF